MYYYNFKNYNFNYNNNKKILKIIKKKINKKNKLKIFFLKKKIVIFKKKIKKKKNKIIKKYLKIKDNILQLIKFKIFKILKNFIIKEKFIYFKKKINNIIKLKIKNIINNFLILLDKFDNEIYYKLNYYDINKFFIKKKNYYFLIKNVIYIKKKKKIKIFITRNDNLFIINLLKLEIPEINNNLIKIKQIVRIPEPNGMSKIIIYNNIKNKKINLIGSCIGIKGIRIKNILNYLDNENINIIKYTDNIFKYIKRLFYNINILNIKIKKYKIYLLYDKNYKNQLIGKNGNNIKLCKLLLNKYKLILKCQ